jgi:hypothetical protein
MPCSSVVSNLKLLKLVRGKLFQNFSSRKIQYEFHAHGEPVFECYPVESSPAITPKGPAKLYRIVDPSNEGGGIFWMAEKEFKAIKNHDEWRSKFAVKPEWNQNGWVVEYEVKAGETLPIWRGPAASQELKGTNRYLEGGGEQIVFFPGSRDEMINATPRINHENGQPLLDQWGNIDRRVEYKDVTGETAAVKLRENITDPHIKGPIATGWGASDYTQEEAKRILLTVPALS